MLISLIILMNTGTRTATEGGEREGTKHTISEKQSTTTQITIQSVKGGGVCNKIHREVAPRPSRNGQENIQVQE